MSFAKTEEQRQLLHLFSKLADKFAQKASNIDKLGLFPFENIEDLKKVGYPTFTLPISYGGKGISLYEFVLYQEKLAEGDGSTALSMGWHLGILKDIFENNRWKKESLAFIAHEVVQKGVLINRAASEPETGSPTRGGRPLTTARKEGEYWVINGKKSYTTMAPVLDFILVTAYVEETDSICEFLVPRKNKGVEIEENWNSVALRGTGSHTLHLTDVQVPREALVDPSSNKRTNRANGWLLHIPACYMGIAKAARNYAVHFASTHSPNSIAGPIKSLSNVQHLLGNIELELLQARHFLYSVAEKWDQTPLTERYLLIPELFAVKHAATNTAIHVVDQAMRIVGAKSLFADNPLQRLYRDVRAGLHNPPMDDMTITILAANALDRYENQDKIEK